MNEEQTKVLARKLEEAANQDWPGGSPQRIARLQTILNEALGVVVAPLRLVPQELPRWQCHKVVRADRVVRVEPVRDGGRIIEHWHLACGMVVEVDHSLARGVSVNHDDAAGGYYVRYTDGYASWSPAKAFEEGYVRLEDAEAPFDWAAFQRLRKQSP